MFNRKTNLKRILKIENNKIEDIQFSKKYFLLSVQQACLYLVFCNCRQEVINIYLNKEIYNL